MVKKRTPKNTKLLKKLAKQTMKAIQNLGIILLWNIIIISLDSSKDTGHSPPTATIRLRRPTPPMMETPNVLNVMSKGAKDKAYLFVKLHRIPINQ